MARGDWTGPRSRRLISRSGLVTDRWDGMGHETSISVRPSCWRSAVWAPRSGTSAGRAGSPSRLPVVDAGRRVFNELAARVADQHRPAARALALFVALFAPRSAELI